MTKELFTLEEYFDFEGKSLHKNEFHNGRIFPLPETSINHNRVVKNVAGHLFFHLQKRSLEVFHGLQKIYISSINHILYPDVFVVGSIEKLNEYAITNPSLIVEVTSPTTLKYDRRNKFKKYQAIPSFQEYILIDQDTPVVEVLSKTPSGWVIEIYLGLEETVKLPSLDCEIKMSDIYKNIENLDYP